MHQSSQKDSDSNLATADTAEAPSSADDMSAMLHEIASMTDLRRRTRSRSRFARPLKPRDFARKARRPASSPDGLKRADSRSSVVIGVFVGLNETGDPLIQYPPHAARNPLAARSVVPLDLDRLGREVVLGIDRGNPKKPIILGMLCRPGETMTRQSEPTTSEPPRTSDDSSSDKDRLVLTAGKEIILRCGAASITLTHAGKVLIRGAYLLSRSSGINRIKGGSVQIN